MSIALGAVKVLCSLLVIGACVLQGSRWGDVCDHCRVAIVPVAILGPFSGTTNSPYTGGGGLRSECGISDYRRVSCCETMSG